MKPSFPNVLMPEGVPYIASSPGVVQDPLGFTFIGNKQKLIHDLLEVRFLLEPSIAAMAAAHADENDIKKITALCDEMEALLKRHDEHTQKDIEFHTAIALSSKNVVVPRLIPVINSSIPLFVETTSGDLHEETIETHREIADAIAGHDPLRAQRQSKHIGRLLMQLPGTTHCALRMPCIFI